MLFLARWARRLSWKETAEAFRTSWDEVFDAVEHVVTWGLEHRVLGPIDAIDVDEIQYAKGHKFYKTRNGARMGDLFMSLIHTCELNGVNPFDYLIELQRHAGELKRVPSEWMP